MERVMTLANIIMDAVSLLIIGVLLWAVWCLTP